MGICFLSQWLTLYTLVEGNEVWINSFKKVVYCSPANLQNENIILQCDVGKSGFSEDDVSKSIVINFDYYFNGSIQRFKEKNDFENKTKILWSVIEKSYFYSTRNLTIFNASNSDMNIYFCSVYGRVQPDFKLKLLARENFTLSNIEKTQCDTIITSMNDGKNDEKKQMKNLKIILVAITSLAILLLLMTIMVLLLKMKKKRKFGKKGLNEENTAKNYDVNICYAPEDREWVINTLVVELERTGIKTFVDVRDDTPGNFIAENIMTAIHNSNHTIVVISPHFIKNNTCKKTLEIASSPVVSHHVIPILYRSCAIPSIIKDKTYLEWNHDDVRPHFWDKLFRKVRNS